ncbi:MAG: M20/M25/M40 family metallo-hydrolase [Puniceicoccales bacterium]|nr:M20/M25/M40 family metallo-hydrolase [Puniceicoccales bacterium]
MKKFLADYIACKSVSSDRSCAAGMADARRHLVKFFKSLSIDAREISVGGHAVVFAKTEQKPNRPTILVYGHYDVQPADDLELWDSDPFTLVERGGRLYGRGASDNKGGHSAMLLAIGDTLAAGEKIFANLKFVIEGEEEIGSCSMPRFLREMRDELGADFAIVADTWSLDEKNIVITTGLRGLVGCEISVRGCSSDIHSGYGGCIPNAIGALADICSSLHANGGAINIPGFYDAVTPPEEWELLQMKRLPMSDADMQKLFGIKQFQLPDARFSALETMRFLPTLEFNGICGGFQGDGIKTIIPHVASAKITCRLVPNQDAESVKCLLQKTLVDRCPKEMLLSVKFEQASAPYWIDVERIKNPAFVKIMKLVDSEIEDVFGNGPIYLRDGGSIGIVPMMKSILGIDSLLIGLSTADDNIHGPNESISLPMVEKGRKFFRSLFSKIR